MARVIHVFRQPDRFVAGTVGQPGERTFYLQASEESRLVSVALEKQQVAVLAERIGSLLEEVHRRFGAEVPAEVPDDLRDTEPLVVPVEEEFKVGTMGLGWDAESRAVVIELLAITEEEVDEAVVLDDTEEEHAALRAWEPSPRVVRVLEADVPAGALLLEGLVPGTQVGSSGGVAAVPVRRLADLLRELHTPPPPPGLPTLAQRVDYIFDLFRRRRPEQDHSAAHAAAAALAGDRVPTRLLHGDLHLGNVLDGGARGLVVIDPRPCVGDPAVDAVDFAYAGPDLRARIEALSAVVDGDRLAAWCAAFAPYFPSQPA
ncbi:DUF3090 family protein [Saccharothrix coeruleofusca]|uniref:Streptomycin 6-kinase n=1 Tax=Saccharothrix coeruleofusca TaxID=33919 RepID=A0A918AKR4_9PSEU|nr:DUF3090 family protein [Saccharothrix coeruleofusca]GGP53798.1 hypothetical protein GCM10010185_27600 [Saccharothrix coeruleofusca]